MYETKKLYRSKKNRVLFGVCAGLADYFHVNATVMRVSWIFASIVFGFPVFIYLVLVFAVPEEGIRPGKDNREEEFKKFANNLPNRLQGFLNEVRNRKKATYKNKIDWVKWGLIASFVFVFLDLFIPGDFIGSIVFVAGTFALIYFIAKNKNWIKNNVDFNFPNKKKNYYSNDIVRMQKNSQKQFPFREILFVVFLVALLLIYLINNYPWFAEQYENIKDWMFNI